MEGELSGGFAQAPSKFAQRKGIPEGANAQRRMSLPLGWPRIRPGIPTSQNLAFRFFISSSTVTSAHLSALPTKRSA